MTRRMVTGEERKQAARQSVETVQAARRGLMVSRSVAARARVQVIRAYRSRARRLGVREKILALKSPLRDSMIASHLYGVRRSWLATPKLALASDSLYSKVLGLVEKRAEVDIDALQELYSTSALRVLEDASDEVEVDLRALIADLHAEGAHVGQAVSALEEEFERLGLDAEGPKLETIFRTQTAISYGAGRWMMDQDPDVQEILWGYKYVTTGDDRVRESHAELEGVTLPKDHPFWESMWPPNGWNCRCQVIPVFEDRDEVEPPEDYEADEGFEFNAGIVLGGGDAPTISLAFDESDHPRDESGKFTSGSNSAKTFDDSKYDDDDIDDRGDDLSELMREFHNTNDRSVLVTMLESYPADSDSIDGAVMRQEISVRLKDKFDAEGNITLMRGDSKTGKLAKKTFHKSQVKAALPWEGEVIVEEAAGVIRSWSTDKRWAERFARYPNYADNIAKSLAFDESAVERDDHGRFAEEAGAGTQAKERARRLPRRKMPESVKAKIAKAAHVMVDARTQRYAEDVCEPQLAKMLGGESLDDNEPVDVVLELNGQSHGIELKVMTLSANAKITMNRYAMVRKVAWERERGSTAHTVVFDDTQGRENRVIRYRRGGGSFRVDGMHRVEGGARELKKLLETPDDELPESARRTDDVLRVGVWRRVRGETAYKNSRTGEVVRAKVKAK